MTTIKRICAHDVKFEYFSRSPIAIPEESDIEHVENMIHENYLAGELVSIRNANNGRQYEFRGWWSIQSA